MTTEQTYTNDSITMRIQRVYGDVIIRERAFAFQMRILLMISEFESKTQLLQERLQMLLKRNPKKLDARQTSMDDLISIALKKYCQDRIQGKFYCMKMVVKSDVM